MAAPAGGGIFVSYRRQETEHVAGRLADRLALRFGAERVFMDVDSIAPGTDFTKAITAAVSRCDVLLALIGRQWRDVVDRDGVRRLEDPDDFVVQEIRAALERDIPVVPILVDGATMPRPQELPASLAQFSHRHAVRLDAETFRADSGMLLDALERMVPPVADSASPPSVADPTPTPSVAHSTPTPSVTAPTPLPPVPEPPPPEDRPAQEKAPGPPDGAGPQPDQPSSPERPPDRRLLLIAGAVVVALGVAIAAFQLIPSGPGSTNPTASPTPTTSASPATTAPATPAAFPQSAPLPDTTLIAPRTLNGDTDLWLVDTTTGATTLQLTSASANDTAPIISPDRRAVAYIQDPGILRVAAADGTGDRPFFATTPADCPTVLRPAWNPVDPSRLAIVCVDGAGRHTLRVFAADGTEVGPLDVGFDQVDDVSYSPDGKTIVYWAKSSSSQEGAALYTIAADGSAAPVRLTDGGATDDADAVWSPDGQHIAFRRCTTGSNPPACDIYVMDVASRAVRGLAVAPGTDQDPTWSPDGTSIAFKSNRPDGSPAGTDQFWIVQADGTGLRQIPAGEGVATSAPAWGPR
ncbi:MAG TPA: TIR domain-containing protein [Blastococcus sp.]